MTRDDVLALVSAPMTDDPADDETFVARDALAGVPIAAVAPDRLVRVLGPGGGSSDARADRDGVSFVGRDDGALDVDATALVAPGGWVGGRALRDVAILFEHVAGLREGGALALRLYLPTTDPDGLRVAFGIRVTGGDLAVAHALAARIRRELLDEVRALLGTPEGDRLVAWRRANPEPLVSIERYLTLGAADRQENADTLAALLALGAGRIVGAFLPGQCLARLVREAAPDRDGDAGPGYAIEVSSLAAGAVIRTRAAIAAPDIPAWFAAASAPVDAFCWRTDDGDGL